MLESDFVSETRKEDNGAFKKVFEKKDDNELISFCGTNSKALVNIKQRFQIKDTQF